jgi:hypothetical protein
MTTPRTSEHSAGMSPAADKDAARAYLERTRRIAEVDALINAATEAATLARTLRFLLDKALPWVFDFVAALEKLRPPPAPEKVRSEAAALPAAQLRFIVSLTSNGMRVYDVARFLHRYAAWIEEAFLRDRDVATLFRELAEPWVFMAAVVERETERHSWSPVRATDLVALEVLAGIEEPTTRHRQRANTWEKRLRSGAKLKRLVQALAAAEAKTGDRESPGPATPELDTFLAQALDEQPRSTGNSQGRHPG